MHTLSSGKQAFICTIYMSAGKQVVIPADTDCHELVGTRFLVLGSWWKGATHTQRQTLYPAKCVEFDACHPFVSRKRKPGPQFTCFTGTTVRILTLVSRTRTTDLKVVTIKSFSSAIKFELTRPQDQAWNTGDLWMTLKRYQPSCLRPHTLVA